MPKRIISLCPSTTETLIHMGAGSRLVGRTDYCCHPVETIADIPSVGGTKRVDMADIDVLKPDLILSVLEENSQSDIEILSQKYPVLILNPVDIATTYDAIAQLGAAIGLEKIARQLNNEIASGLATLMPVRSISVAYLIWRKPYMVVGNGTFIHSMLTQLGFDNVAARLPGRYPELTRNHLQACSPDYLFAASEPFPFKTSHIDELSAWSGGMNIELVDGEMFGWHGVRMLKAIEFFRHWLKRFY